MRSTIFRYFQKIGLKTRIAKSLADIAESGHLVDDAGFIDLANHLVETRVQETSQHQYIKRIYESCDEERYFGLYCKLWLQSKYGSSTDLLQTILRTKKYWMSDNKIGQLVGSFGHIFVDHESIEFEKLINTRNVGFRDCFKFHKQLSTNIEIFDSMFDALSIPNPSKGTGITHAKFLCLVSALTNEAASINRRRSLLSKHDRLFKDVYYRKKLLNIKFKHTKQRLTGEPYVARDKKLAA